MIINCDNSDQKEILAYIGEDYPQCLYLYMDVIKYGCSSETTRTWIQKKNGEITAVILAYHTALHIFSRNNDFDAKEICNLVNEITPTLVNATADTIKKLEPFLAQLSFVSEFGHIGEWMREIDEINDREVVEAEEDDIQKIAKMLFDDEDIGASYSFEDLLNQMRDRLQQGYVHSYVIRKGNKPVAHVGTGAEMEGVCTIAYTITDADYRGQGLAGRLYNYVCSKMKKEGKRVFSVYYPASARLFHHKMGFVDVCEYGKLFKSIE